MLCIGSIILSLFAIALVYFSQRYFEFSEDIKFLIVLLPLFGAFIWFVVPTSFSNAVISDNQITITPYSDHITVHRISTFDVKYNLREGVGVYVLYDKKSNEPHRPYDIHLSCSSGIPKTYESDLYSEDEDGDKYYEATQRVFMCAGKFKPGDRIVLTADYSIKNPYTLYGRDKALNYKIEDDIGVPILHTTIEVPGAQEVISFPYEGGNEFDYIDRGHYSVLALISRNGDTSGVFERYRTNWESESSKSKFYGQVVSNINRTLWIPLGIMSIFTAIVGVIAIYWFFGRETKQPSTEVLHYVPEKIEPWKVNARYGGGFGVTNDNAFVATIMDWVARGHVELHKDHIKIISYPSHPNSYESSLIRFFEFFSEGDKFYPSKVISKIKSFGRSKAFEADRIVRSLSRVDYEWIKTSMSHKGTYLMMLLAVINIIAGLLVYMFIDSITDSIERLSAIYFGVGIYLLGAAVVDTYIFRRFHDHARDLFYKWMAFKRLLSDYSLIKKYKPEDSSMWEDWLIYGAALGEAENVIKAIQKFKVSVPHFEDIDTSTLATVYMIRSVRTTASSKASSYRSRSHSGGSGASGGFGGGGSFAR